MCRNLYQCAENVVKALFLAFLPLPALAETPIQPLFTEETATSGISSIYAGDWAYMVGGGAASFDCNGDARPDLVIAGGTNPAQLYLNQSSKGGPLSFTPQQSGLELTQVLGAYPLDVDSDGISDLMLLRQGENQLMRGLGNCKFAASQCRLGL